MAQKYFCRVCRNEVVRRREKRFRRRQGILPVNGAHLPSLRYWRIEADLTQRQLAAAAGLSKKTIINLELGRDKASLKVRQEIAAVLGVQPGALMIQPPDKPRKLRAGYGPRKNTRKEA